MKIERLNELKKALDDENISYGELAEIDAAAIEAGIEVTDEMMSIDVLLALEEKLSNGDAAIAA